LLGVRLLIAGFGVIAAAALAVLAIVTSAPALAVTAGSLAVPSTAYLASVAWRRRRTGERGPLFG
jgi:hypothetical protein